MRLRPSIAVLSLGASLAACAAQPAPPADPNAGLLRDFTDGKFDAAGHPLNAVVTQAEVLCAAAGPISDGAVRLTSDAACTGTGLGGVSQQGDLLVNARISIVAHPATGDIVQVQVVGADGHVLGQDTLTVARLRDTAWIDFPVSWTSDGSAVTLRIVPAAGATVDVDYLEVVPQRFGLVLAPGSGPIADAADLELEMSHAIDRVTLDGVDITDHYNGLLASGTATSTTTMFRTLVDVRVGDLLPTRGDSVELVVHADPDSARLELRTAAPACTFVGDPNGKKVLITGFQPFPADASHDNVAGVAVMALDASKLTNARVMRLVMPVEYDHAAAEVSDAIARCQPDIVISFGQGGDAIALEETAYNLQDTGEVAGGVPDNRGIIRVAAPIDPTAPATRATLLPLDDIQRALEAAGEVPQRSTDPGRYVCNNVMFADVGAMTGKRAGFIHLPYTTEFDDATRAHFGTIVQLAIQAAVDAP